MSALGRREQIIALAARHKVPAIYPRQEYVEAGALREHNMRANQHHYLEGVKALWIEQKNPYWIWVAVKTSIRNDEPFPDWVCEYLEQVADQLLATGAASGDFARKLPQILGLRSKSGPKHPLKIGRRMLRNEEYAMKFAKHILMGKNRRTHEMMRQMNLIDIGERQTTKRSKQRYGSTLN